MFQDSQDSNTNSIDEGGSQQDLFDDRVAAPTPNLPHAQFCCDGCKSNSLLFKEIVKKLKDLKQCVNTAAKPGRSFTCIEKTDMERPLTDYLKSRFPKNPFLADPDTELKAKLMSLKRRLVPESDTQEVLRAGVKFSTRKMVDFRSQTKNKMLSRNESADLGCKSLKDLGKALFSSFQCQDEEAVENMTVALRAFSHDKKAVKKAVWGALGGLLDILQGYPWGSFGKPGPGQMGPA
ncbi:unnamed protein product [Mytilus coruscus]|uniref:Uncharacterized protein n=1 Tax=Mytilus coruscus TaxID=42192 RepID=A0A6J7ZZ86_MYTCO|nr:unnamed protein product [Mytilus coruscus]